MESALWSMLDAKSYTVSICETSTPSETSHALPVQTRVSTWLAFHRWSSSMLVPLT